MKGGKAFNSKQLACVGGQQTDREEAGGDTHKTPTGRLCSHTHTGFCRCQSRFPTLCSTEFFCYCLLSLQTRKHGSNAMWYSTLLCFNSTPLGVVDASQKKEQPIFFFFFIICFCWEGGCTHVNARRSCRLTSGESEGGGMKPIREARGCGWFGERLTAAGRRGRRRPCRGGARPSAA